METSKYQTELSIALRIGSIVLLENVGDTVPRKLFPIFKLSRQKHQVGK
jgi:dynein heavy chain